VKFDKPLARTREYVEIIRKAMTRERLTHDGEHWTLPLPGGPGKPIKLTVHPQREHIPLYIAAIGPKNLEQTGEIADGALLIFPSAEHLEETAVRHLRAGREKAGRTLDGFDICPTVPLAVGDDKDITTPADTFRPYTALYVGGMGSRKQNFYNQLARRMGYEQEAAEIQDKYLSGDKQGAAAAVPHDLIDSTTLLGSVDRIADRMKAYAAAGVTTLTLAPAGFTLDERLASLRAGTEALERAGLARSSTAVVGARGSSPPRPSRGTTPGRRRGYARAPAVPIACRPDRARVVPVLPPFGAVVRHTCCPGRAPAFDSSPASPRKRWSRCFRPGVCSR